MDRQEIESRLSAIDRLLLSEMRDSKFRRGLVARRERFFKLAIQSDLAALAAEYDARGRHQSAEIARQELARIRR